MAKKSNKKLIEELLNLIYIMQFDLDRFSTSGKESFEKEWEIMSELRARGFKVTCLDKEEEYFNDKGGE